MGTISEGARNGERGTPQSVPEHSESHAGSRSVVISSDQMWEHTGGARGACASRKGDEGRRTPIVRLNIARRDGTGTLTAGSNVGADTAIGRGRTFPWSDEVTSAFSAQQQEMLSVWWLECPSGT